MLPNTLGNENLTLTRNLTYFGSEAIDFKNSLVKERENFKQKPEKFSNIQKIERKSMPVKTSDITSTDVKRDENDEGKKKIVKLKTKK